MIKQVLLNGNGRNYVVDIWVFTEKRNEGILWSDGNVLYLDWDVG